MNLARHVPTLSNCLLKWHVDGDRADSDLRTTVQSSHAARIRSSNSELESDTHSDSEASVGLQFGIAFESGIGFRVRWYRFQIHISRPYRIHSHRHTRKLKRQLCHSSEHHSKRHSNHTDKRYRCLCAAGRVI